ncbi:MAG: polymer-forming cytoskeletal protein [Hyphomicrobiales bacterium]|nr:polymer-forming cytoskeletal protein [Hyphomicrobiales bacterium]
MIVNKVDSGAPRVGVFPAAPNGQDMQSQSAINADLTIIGNVTSRGNVRLDGTIEGDLHCTSLMVSETGMVKGRIVANNEVIVLGRVTGLIFGKRVMLHSTANVESDIYHQGIGIEMGTRYDGTLRWTEDLNGAASAAGTSTPHSHS